jgi:MFS family permease
MRGRFEALKERPFRLLFIGQAVSLLGDGMVGVALAFAVLEETGSASDLGVVLAARTVPLVAFLLVGGVWADRLPRRALMVTTDLLRFAAHGAMAALLIAGSPGVWTLAALAAIAGAASAFFNPAISGIMPAVVSTERLQQANALRGLTEGVGRIAGPALAGVLVVGVGPGWALAVDAATFAVSAAFLAAMPMPAHVPVESHSFARDLRDGWDDFRSRTWLWTTVASTTFGNMLFAAYFVLGPLVADRELGGAGAWALIASAFGIGLLVGGIVLLQLDPRRPALVATLAVALYTLPLAFLAIPAPAAVIALAALVAGAGLAVANNLWETTQQRHVPPELLSRVSSYDWFGSLAAVPIGMLLWGPIADVIGVSEALWIAFVLQLSSILILLAVREIRELPAYPLRESQ